MKRDIYVTIALSQRKRGGGFKSKLVRNWSELGPGEVAVRLQLAVDDAWFTRTTEQLRVEVPEPPAFTASAKVLP